MNKDKYVFAQLVEFLDNNKFRHLVDKYDWNRYVSHSLVGISSWHSCSDNSVIVRVCVMWSLHWRLTNPNATTLAWGVIL